MLSTKAFGISGGILCSLWVGWSVLVSILGIGNTPFAWIDEIYLGWLSPTVGGLILGLILGFVDGFIAGFLFAWIYNKICGKSCCSN